jgi:glutamate racemase
VSSYILIFDSGSGGRFVLSKFKKVLPNEDYLLFCDTKNCPYGNKKPTELKALVLSTLQRLVLKYNIKLIVIACNTVSSMFKDYLEDYFSSFCPIMFVEPKVEPKILSKKTLIIGTKNTINHNKKIKSFAKNSNVFLQGFGSLAYKIDFCDGKYFLLQNFLNIHLAKFRKYKIKNVIIACTHFNFIKREIKIALNSNVKFFENSICVAKNAKKLLSTLNALNIKNREPKTIFLTEIN